MTGLACHAAGLSDRGPVRAINEDAFLDRADLGIWAVADGLGGHSEGEVASRMVVEGLAGIPKALDARSLLAAVEASLAQTHERLLARGGGRRITGSTVVVLLVAERHWALLWAGDSRGYRLRHGRIELLTHDHSHVQELIDRGLLPPEAARLHPHANRITRALGVGGTLALDTATGGLEPGDVFLLCSDGLSGVLDEPALAEALGRPPKEAVSRLVELALAAGGEDNITAVAVAVEPKEPPTLRPKAPPSSARAR